MYSETSRPTMSRTSVFLSTSFTLRVSITLPSRRTVPLSAISNISSSLWETYIMEVPLFLSLFIISKRCLVSALERLAVGSSNATTLELYISDRAIAIICICAALSFLTCSLSEKGQSSSFRASLQRLYSSR